MADELRHGSAVDLVRRARECGSVAELREVSAGMAQLQIDLVAARATCRELGEAITSVTDALTRRLIELGEGTLGPAPGPYAWLACGSQARREQTTLSDQDNALMLPPEPLGAAGERWFESMAAGVNEGLAACGFPPCRGGIMASNATWRRAPEGWWAHFASWIDRPTTHALMHATIFFDMRVVSGDDAPLRLLFERIRERVRGNEIFLELMVQNAIDVRPPLGVLGRLARIREGEHVGKIDVKKGGVMTVVDLARVHALAAGSAALSTIDRLHDAAALGALSVAGADELCAAFELSSSIRARHQAAQLAAGQRPDNFVRPEDLPPAELLELKEAFRVIRRHQNVLERR